jgi:cytochrome c oxidase subunit III
MSPIEVNPSLNAKVPTDHATDLHVGVEHHHDEAGNSMFGFIVFLLSESVIFFSFFAGYIIYKTNALDWLPTGVEGLETREPTINTVILVSSSFVIYIAERFLHVKNLWGFRLFWLLTMAMGSYFLYGQAVEWGSLTFGFTDGVFGDWISRAACADWDFIAGDYVGAIVHPR